MSIDIPGATSSTYTLVTADLGEQISVRVTATNSAGSASASSALTSAVTSTGTFTDGWHTLPIGNGGLLSGINTAPDGSKVVRTDSYGAYVWDDGIDEWRPLLIQSVMPAGSEVYGGDGVDEVVLDPQNSNTIWMQWQGFLYKSTNKGVTMTATDFPNQSYPHMNNGDTRTQGPFMAVDPVCSNIVYASTPARGVYRTTNGTNFTQMTTFAGGLPSQVQYPPPKSIGTDNTSLATGMGTKLFRNNSAAFGNLNGKYLKVWRTSDRTVQFFGTVSNSTGTQFDLAVDTAFGTGGPFTDWTIGQPFQWGGGNSGVCAGHRILFVPDGQTVTAFGQTVSKNVYIHTHGVNTWKSSDGGVNWTPVLTTGTFLDADGPPNKAIRRWTADPFGVVWVCGDNYAAWDNLYRYDDSVPANARKQLDAAFGHPSYDAVMVDLANSPSKELTTAIFLADSKFIVLFTKDGGASTQGYGDRPNRFMTTPANDVLWFQDLFDHDPNHAVPVCDARMDPLVPGKIWVAGEGCYYFTYSRTATQPVTLTQQSRGVEEFIPAQVNVPSTGDYWMTAWDLPLFQSPGLDEFPAEIQGSLGGGQTILTIGYGFDWQPGGILCCVISDSKGNELRSAAEGTCYSTNNGVSWTIFPQQPHAALIDQPGVTSGGSIACADASTYVYVHCHEDLLPRETTNAGVSWSNISIPGGTPVNGWGFFTYYCPECRIIESDKTNGDIYLYNCNRGGSFGTGDAIYKRTKSTGLWSIKQDNPGIVQPHISGKMKHVTGNAQHFFFCSGVAGAHPFSFTNDGWTTFNPVNVNFTHVATFACCAPYPGQSYPGILVYGTYSGVLGFYLCKDFNPTTRAGTWTVMSHPFIPLAAPKDIGGDPGIAGRFVAFTTAGAWWSQLP